VRLAHVAYVIACAVSNRSQIGYIFAISMLGTHARTYLLGVNPQMYDHRIWHEECSNIGVSFDTTEFQYIEPFRRDPTV